MNYLNPLLASNAPATARSDETLPFRETRFATEIPAQRAQRAAPAEARTPPTEESIETLMGMGFDRNDAIVALQTTNNNVQQAAGILLDGRT